jgi:hypothetical protein
VTTRYLVRVAGPLSRVVTDTVSDRFGPLDVHREAASTVLAVPIPDQPGLRSLLTALFDFGHEVLSVSREDREQTPSPFRKEHHD